MREKHTLTDSDPIQRSRRTILKVISGVSVGLGTVGVTSAQNQTEIRLGGRVSGWVGQSPGSIQNETNPTLTLKPGTTYKLSWTDLDGVEHRLQILDANEKVLEQTEDGEEQGETKSVTFTATQQMKQYRCKYHPESMRGKVKQ
jgi:plastocyanin